MGWYDRDWYLGGHRAQVFDTNGNGGPTAWWDGRIVGGWGQDNDGRVELRLLEDVGREAKRALTAPGRRADRVARRGAGQPTLPVAALEGQLDPIDSCVQGAKMRASQRRINALTVKR